MDSIYQPPTRLLLELNDLFNAPNKITQDQALNYSAQIIKEKALVYQHLKEQAWRYLLPRGKDTTELDRKTDLEARTSESHVALNQLEEYLELLKHVFDR